MFKIITMKCNELGSIFMLNVFVVDFVQAVHNAVYEMFSLRLITNYRPKSETRNSFRNIIGLSFLNLVEVDEFYTDDFI